MNTSLANTAPGATDVDVGSLTPNLPEYTVARHFLRLIAGVPYSVFRSLQNSISQQQGTPQETASWTDPDSWIPQRLRGEAQELALRIWRDSGGKVNPRHLRGSWYLASRHQLLVVDAQNVIRVTERGHQFLDHPGGHVVAEIDNREGILIILRLVADRGPGWRSDFLTDFAEYCRSSTSIHSDAAIKSGLYNRLVNLVERGFVTRSGLTYEITEAGLAYLDRSGQMLPGSAVNSKQTSLQRLASEISREARDQLAEHLAQMNPFKFEALIKLLLEEMGYNAVEVTSPTNDRGVDVIASIELGISSVREVVQVKRYKGTINRRILDELRGSLHRFDAVRGTIITTGSFSSGTKQAAFERGAAPITLIDGEKLLDLLRQYEIGVRKKAVEYVEFDPTRLAQFSEAEGDELAGSNG
jgi:restriction system protein